MDWMASTDGSDPSSGTAFPGAKRTSAPHREAIAGTRTCSSASRSGTDRPVIGTRRTSVVSGGRSRKSDSFAVLASSSSRTPGSRARCRSRLTR
jgi:hypothetical protein